MYDHVHIDEKWFYITKVKKKYYLLFDEEPPERSTKSKRYITKVMFMAAVARPQWDPNRGCYFDCKIGIWPFIVQEAAKRTSKNRPRGAMVTKAVTSVDRAMMKEMITEKIMPAIRQKMPRGRRSSPIFIQQDNAKPHTTSADISLVEEGQKEGWDIRMINQPPNSPDFNVLDLGFFNAIQSLQHQEAPTSIDELVSCVEQAFNKLSRETLDNTFLSYQNTLESCMKVEGGNKYKLVHMGKEKLRREGRLPVSIECNPDSILAARETIDSFYENATTTA